MKKLLLLCFFVAHLVSAQKINFTYKNNNAHLEYELLIDTSQQLSQWKRMLNAKGIKEKKNSLSSFFVNKNGVFYFRDKVLGSRVFVTDTPLMKWEKKNGTKKILGYDCKMATTAFRGRTYTAYYTPKIKSNKGPWKFEGLKGLILLVESTDGNYKFEATKVDLNPIKVNATFINQTIKNNTFLTWKEYTTEYLKSIQQHIKDVKCDCSSDGQNILKISKIEKLHPNLHDEGIIY